MRFEAGRPVAINGVEFADPVALVLEANTIGGRHGLGVTDQIENRIIEAKSRGIYEAPGMALLHIAYERLLNAIHNEDTVAQLPRRGPPPRPPHVRGPLARPAVAHAARVHPALGRLGRHRRGHAAPAPRRRLHDPRHHGSRLSYHPDKLSMERVGDAAFGPDDRIGQLTMRNLDIADSRSRLEQYAAAGLIGGATAELVGQLEAGEAAEILGGAEVRTLSPTPSSAPPTSPPRAPRSTPAPTDLSISMSWSIPTS